VVKLSALMQYIMAKRVAARTDPGWTRRRERGVVLRPVTKVGTRGLGRRFKVFGSGLRA